MQTNQIASPKVKTYPVIEIFGPTIQGEGAMAGRPTHFLRMGGCDYRCAWCDTDYAVLPEKVRANAKKLTIDDILAGLNDLKGNPMWVTISGGNPALHDLDDLVAHLQLYGTKVAVETQGSLWKDWLAHVDQLTISPKPPSSKMYKSAEDLPKFMEHIPDWKAAFRRVCLKIPVQDDGDYEYAIRVHELYPDIPFYFSVVTLMGGLSGDYEAGFSDSRDTLLDRYRWLAEKCAGDERARDTTALPQLHALLWGHGRGF